MKPPANVGLGVDLCSKDQTAISAILLGSVSDSGIDDGIIKRCKNGDTRAQKILYMAYVEDMMLLCLRYISDKEDAREVLMDSFLKFFNSITGFEYRGEGSVKAWLKKITVNSCLMYLRKRRISFDAIDDKQHRIEIPVRDNIIEGMSARDILKLIHALPAGCKTVFNLVVFEGLSHKEISELLGIAEGTSKSQFHLAKAILKGKILINI